MAVRLVWTELKLLTREPITLVVSLLFPIVLMVLLAGSFGNEADPESGGIGGVDIYVPIYAAATVAVMGLLGLPTHLAAYREHGVLQRFRASGVSASLVMVAQMVVGGLLVTVGVVAMVTIGFTGFDVTAPVSVIGVLSGFMFGTLAFAGLGLLLGSLLSTARAAQGLGLLLFFGLFFIAGGGPPPSLLPDAVNRLVGLTPMGPLIAAISDPGTVEASTGPHSPRSERSPSSPSRSRSGVCAASRRPSRRLGRFGGGRKQPLPVSGSGPVRTRPRCHASVAGAGTDRVRGSRCRRCRNRRAGHLRTRG